jgi:hypothetical protein
MVRLTLTSGPYAGRSREFKGEVAEGGSAVSAIELLGSLVEHGWGWEIDLSSATAEEVFTWTRADMVARILRAVIDGRPVWVLSRRFEPVGDLEKVVGEIEDAIVKSGDMVRVLSDDDQGVVISSNGYEQ